MKPLVYGSVCSGIEAASVAWEPLGWQPAFFSQFDPEHDYDNGPDFPSRVLAHHWPHVPNHGDMTKFEDWPDHAIDVLVGGTPCQDFSIAGLRAGLDGNRGNLMLVYAAIARRYRPDWLAWENVPGVLSSNGGRDFASLLGLLSGQRITVPADGWRTAGVVPGYEGAYGLAWRVLDAQYVRVDGYPYAVPQRRRRVFVVGYLGDWRRAAAVLLERESLSGDSAPRREAGKNVTGTLAGGARRRGGFSNDDIPIAAASLTASDGGVSGKDAAEGRIIAMASGQANAEVTTTGVGPTLTLLHEAPIVAHSLRAEGFDASEDGTGRGTPIVPVPVAPTMRAGGNRTGGDRPPGTDVDTADSLIPISHALCVDVLQTSYALQGNMIGRSDDAGPQGSGVGEDVSFTLTKADVHGVATPARQDGDAIGFGWQEGLSFKAEAGSVNALTKSQTVAVATPPALSFGRPIETTGHQGDVVMGPGDVWNTLAAQGGNNGGGAGGILLNEWSVRRLTPKECERLQGFPDDHTLIEVRGKPAADGPRYKALGNSMACNVMRWIGMRIDMVRALEGDT